MLTGERPEVNPVVAERLRSWGHEDFTSYVALGLRARRSSGACSRTRTSASPAARTTLRLREVTASQGLMLESISERLMETVHAGSPTKHPRVRLEAIEAAGELRIPFTSGILVGIGETEEERVASLEALAAVQRAARPHPGGDPPELRRRIRATTGPRWPTSPPRPASGAGRRSAGEERRSSEPRSSGRRGPSPSRSTT